MYKYRSTHPIPLYEYSHISNTLLQFACNNSFHYTPAIPTAADVAFAAAATTTIAAHISASLIWSVILQELVTRLTVLSALPRPVYRDKIIQTHRSGYSRLFLGFSEAYGKIFLLLLFPVKRREKTILLTFNIH